MSSIPRHVQSIPFSFLLSTSAILAVRQELVADKTRQGLWAVGSDNFPGSLLIRLGLGHDFVARHNPWEEMQALSQVMMKLRYVAFENAVPIEIPVSESIGFDRSLTTQKSVARYRLIPINLG